MGYKKNAHQLVSSIVFVCLLSVVFVKNVFSGLLDPVITNIEINGNAQGGNKYIGGARVSAKLQIPSASKLKLNKMFLYYRSKQTGSEVFIKMGEMKLLNGKYRHRLPLLNYGKYEVKLKATFTTLLISGRDTQPSPRQVVSAFRDFNIQASQECFRFNANNESWTMSSVVDSVSGTPQGNGNCSSTLTDFSGKLTVLFGDQNCFPDVVDGSREKYYRFNLNSPDLIGNKSWKDIKGTAIRVGANVNIKVQPLITYEQEDGSVKSQVVKNGDDSVLYDVGNLNVISFKDIFSAFDIPNNAKIINFQVRVFGKPIDTNYPEAVFYLDTVCPSVKNRPYYFRVLTVPKPTLPRPLFTIPTIINRPRPLN